MTCCIQTLPLDRSINSRVTMYNHLPKPKSIRYAAPVLAPIPALKLHAAAQNHGPPLLQKLPNLHVHPRALAAPHEQVWHAGQVLCHLLHHHEAGAVSFFLAVCVCLFDVQLAAGGGDQSCDSVDSRAVEALEQRVRALVVLDGQELRLLAAAVVRVPHRHGPEQDAALIGSEGEGENEGRRSV